MIMGGHRAISCVQCSVHGKQQMKENKQTGLALTAHKYISRKASKKKKKEPRSGKPKRIAVIRFAHKLAHGIKNVTTRYGVDVFSSPRKLSRLCEKISTVYTRVMNALFFPKNQSKVGGYVYYAG